MVARMMRWPRPPPARKFRVRLVVRRAEGLPPPAEPETEGSAKPRVAVEVRWKGPKASALSSLRRAVRLNRTREEEAAAAATGEGGGSVAVAWEEEFESVVTLAAASHRGAAAFQPWELAFTVFTDVNRGPKIKPSILGTATLNLADYASASEQDIEIIHPLSLSDGAPESAPSLHAHVGAIQKTHLRDLMADAERCKAMTAEYEGIFLDYSRQRATGETMEKLFKLAEAAKLKEKVEKMFRGDRVVIYSPARTASQQGSGKVGRWKINFVSTQKWENPLMGWTSTGDPYANVGEAGLTFDSAESAKAFAEKHSRVPDPQRMIRAYAQSVATLNLLRALPYDF